MVWKWMQSTVTHDLIWGCRLQLQLCHSMTCSFHTKLIKQWETCWILKGGNGQSPILWVCSVKCAVVLLLSSESIKIQNTPIPHVFCKEFISSTTASDKPSACTSYVWLWRFIFWRVESSYNKTELTGVFHHQNRDMSQRSNTPSSSWMKCPLTLESSFGEKSATHLF